MESTDFRIGNLLQDQNGTTLKVDELANTDKMITFYVVDRSKFPLPNGWKAEPIPLTEEWLKRFGFQSDNFTDEDRTPFLRIDDDHGSRIIHVLLGGPTFVVFDDNIVSHIKYVHQLQNLYYALEGEELQAETPKFEMEQNVTLQGHDKPCWVTGIDIEGKAPFFYKVSDGTNSFDAVENELTKG